ncbi:hypothetical protein NKDENANG_01009 [Candidatus Entotheonellaceae bacterium PAL068K]
MHDIVIGLGVNRYGVWIAALKAQAQICNTTVNPKGVSL